MTTPPLSASPPSASPLSTEPFAVSANGLLIRQGMRVAVPCLFSISREEWLVEGVLVDDRGKWLMAVSVQGWRMPVRPDNCFVPDPEMPSVSTDDWYLILAR